jgi:hypothetical protein
MFTADLQWYRGIQPFAPASLYASELLLFISVSDWFDLKVMLPPEVLGKLKIKLIKIQTREITLCTQVE